VVQHPLRRVSKSSVGANRRKIIMTNINNNQVQQSGAGNVLQIAVASSTIKSLDACSIEELRQELRTRKELLQQEEARVLTQLLSLVSWLVLGSGSTWFASHWLPWSHGMMVALGAIGVIFPGIALYTRTQQGESEFSVRQRATLKEIDHLLREKSYATQQRKVRK
jgi:hypothetical protein